MKHIKIYEEINKKKPEIGDFVICEEDEKMCDDITVKSFLSENIGRIVRYRDISDIFNSEFTYVVKYKNVPENKKDFFVASPNIGYCRSMSETEIKFWSKNKKEVEAYLAGNKYNI